MIDFVEDFLKEATSQLSGLEGLQNALEQNSFREEHWYSLYSFFDFVRSTAPFAGFRRSYRLSDAAMREMRKNKTQEGLISVLKKLQRIEYILVSVGQSKTEADGTDEDLLPEKGVTASFSSFGKENEEYIVAAQKWAEIQSENVKNREKNASLERSLREERELKEKILGEKRELEKQHLEFNGRLIALQESLNAEVETVRDMKKKLEQQKYYGDVVHSELRAAGWPYDMEKIQKELAILARRNETKTAIDSLTALKEVISRIRKRSFMKVPRFFQNVVQAASRRYQRPYEVFVNCDVSDGVDKDALNALKQTLIQLADNSFHYARCRDQEKLRLNFSVREDNVYLHCSFSDNGASFDFDTLYKAIQTAGLIEKNITLQPSELLAFLFHNAVKFKKETRGLIRIVQWLEKSGGQVSVGFNDGLRIDFSLPKHFLFDKVLLFRLSGQLLALPLNAVAETVFFDKEEVGSENQKKAFFYWKGRSLPILRLDDAGLNGFGIVVQAGVFNFLLPVQQILDTEYMLSFSTEEEKQEDCRYLRFCTVLESGREPLWLDISELLKQVVLPLPRTVVSVSENKTADADRKESASYLVFKSDPSFFGAVRVDAVLKVEDFSMSPENAIHKKYLEMQGKRLPLRDSCSHDGYPYAQAVLIFKTFALAIHEVIDIIDIPAADNTDFIAYRGRKVPVFSTEL